jgi:golgi-specific brefeldin A-resistance guanine nucleotide exchange factor 1
MQALVRSVFSRLHTLDPIIEEAKLQTNQEDVPDGEIKMTVSSNLPNTENTSEVNPEDQSEKREIISTPVSQPSPLTSAPRPQCTFFNTVLFQAINVPIELLTFLDGLPSILELLRVLINVLDPNDQQHTDSTRLVALGILNTAFEVSGSRLSDFVSLEALVLDTGCKFLFQLARSDNTSVLHLALRTISTVLSTLRKHLKLQQELFLAFTIDRLAPPNPNKALSNKKGSISPRPGTPVTQSPLPVDIEPESEKGSATPPRLLVSPARGETRDLVLESLSQVTSHPSFMVDLYTNYDCDINCENLFERLIEFLTKAGLAFMFKCDSLDTFSRAFILRTPEPNMIPNNVTCNTFAWNFCWHS